MTPTIIMEFKSNYKSIIYTRSETLLFQEVYKDAAAKYLSKNKILFSEALQKLILQVGKLISRALVRPTCNKSRSIEVLNYICVDVLKDRKLLNAVAGSNYNSNGNRVKHYDTMNSDLVKIEEMACSYNRMINLLCKKMKDDTLQKYKFVPRVVKSTSNKVKTKKKTTTSSTKVKSNPAPKVNIINRVINKIENKVQSLKERKATLRASLLKDEGLVNKRGLLGSKKIIMFGVNIDFDSYYLVKDVKVYLKTRNGLRTLKACLGENRYRVDASDVYDGRIELTVKVCYKIKTFIYDYAESNLKGVYC